jgi:ethanolamine ammonia-lyase small subunit
MAATAGPDGCREPHPSARYSEPIPRAAARFEAMTDDYDAAAPHSGTPQTAAGDDGLWADLRRLTAARIGLRRTGASLATEPLLDFQLAHARARDAVHEPLDEAQLIADFAALEIPVVALASAVESQRSYLMRPDLGRRLGPGAESTLKTHADGYDIVFVITGGLSARAVQMHAVPILAGVLAPLRAGWRIAPLVLVRHGRVAVGDAVATALRADLVVVLIGERPGLTAPHSMGAYLTWQPGPQTTDADRNCISNIRPGGMEYADAAFSLVHMLRVMRSRRLSGVQLKDVSGGLLI